MTVVRSFSLLRQKDAAAYYTSLGDNVIDFMNDGYVDDSKPLWLNLGYWKDARTYPDACVAMVELLGTRAGLQPGDEVLDVGVGFAEQDFVLLDRFKVSHITGIDITPVHVDKGRDRVAKRGLEKQIDIRLGSATAMEFPDASFDKVLALECAFHFDTRDQFMREAFDGSRRPWRSEPSRQKAIGFSTSEVRIRCPSTCKSRRSPTNYRSVSLRRRSPPWETGSETYAARCQMEE